MMLLCDYCNGQAVLVKGSVIYPHRPDLYHLDLWYCGPCKAWVGTHKNSNFKPLGRLANAELRTAKMLAHSCFDVIWKSGEMSRTGAYDWLAKKLGIPPGDCHIGEFSVEMCHQVIDICRERGS